MTKTKLLLLLTTLFSFYVSQAQNDSLPISIIDFKQLKDSLSYQKATLALNTKQRSEEKSGISIIQIDSIIQRGIQLNSQRGLGYAYDLKGVILFRNREFETSMEMHKEALSYFQKVKDSFGYRFAYKGMADIEYIRANYSKSINYGLEEKKYIQPTDSMAFSRWYNRLGITNGAFKDFENAEKAFSQSIMYSSKVDIGYTVLTSGNFARVYANQQKLEEAINVLEKAVKLSKTTKERKYIYYVYNTLGDVYMLSEKYKIAKAYVDSTYQITKKLGLDYDMYRAKVTMASIQLELGEYNETEKLLDESISFFKSIDSKSFLFYNYNMYIKLDSLRGNLKGAIGWIREYTKLSDRQRLEDSGKQMQNIEVEYQAEIDKLHIIHQQEMEAAKSRSKLFIFRIYNWIAVGISIISLLLLYNIIQARKKRKKLIQSLQKSNQIKAKLFSIISHDLKNEMHGLGASLELMQSNHINSEEFKKILPLLAKRTNQTSILLNNLLNWSKSQMNELMAKPVYFDVSELITNKFKFFKPKANEKQIKLVNNLLDAKVYADKDMIGIVTQNLIANAVKFCDSGDTISLFSLEKDHFLEIHFSDTGVGIASENVNKLFAEETFTTRGTQNETGTGLGLRICKELIELNKGEISVSSKLGEGSIFKILLPITKI